MTTTETLTRPTRINRLRPGQTVVTGPTRRVVAEIDYLGGLHWFDADVYFTNGTRLRHRDDMPLAVTR